MVQQTNNSLPPIRRILAEDFPQTVQVNNNECSTSWFQRPQYILNNFMYYIYNLLNGGLTFGNNIAAQIEVLSVTTGSTYNTGVFTPIKFTKTLTAKAQGLIIVQITNETNANYTVITTAVGALDWQDLGNGSIQINFISGLANSSTYNVTFLVF